MIFILRKFSLWLLPILMIATGCHRQTALVPPKIHYGFDACADCGMIINDPHYAAALAWRAGTNATIQTSCFDDIGCLLEWRRNHASAEVDAIWVKDVRTAAWLKASTAIYIKSKSLETPMGWGIVAGTGTNDFAALAAGRPALTWTSLLHLPSQAADSQSLNNKQANNE